MVFVTLPLARRFSLPVVLIALLLILFFCLQDSLTPWLTFDRDQLSEHQYWRLLSGQFIHLSLSHLLLNLSGLLMIWLLFAEHTAGYRYLWLIPSISFGSCLGMWLFSPEITLYVGFSGVIYGLFTWGALQDILHKVKFGWLLFAIVLLKTSYEFFFTPIQLGDVTANPLATAAHFFGLCGALICVSIQQFWLRLDKGAE